MDPGAGPGVSAGCGGRCCCVRLCGAGLVGPAAAGPSVGGLRSPGTEYLMVSYSDYLMLPDIDYLMLPATDFLHDLSYQNDCCGGCRCTGSRYEGLVAW